MTYPYPKYNIYELMKLPSNDLYRVLINGDLTGCISDELTCMSFIYKRIEQNDVYCEIHNGRRGFCCSGNEAKRYFEKFIGE